MSELTNTLEIDELRAALLGSPLLFISTFYEIINSRPYNVSNPNSREPHAITISKQLKRVFNLDTKRLIISIPPGHGKSTIIGCFMAYCYAHYPDCNFIYASHTASKAADVVYMTKCILESSFYKKLFPASEISRAFNAKDDFKTVAGGRCKSFGSSGPITGCDAGFAYCDRFSGAVIMDDMHKADEVFSETIRQGIVDNYNMTIKNRPRGPNVPMLYIGHMLHQEDLPSYLKNGLDGNIWEQIVLPAEDDHGNILDEQITTREYLDIEKKVNEYVYWSQYQQLPIAPGGTIFKRDDFELLDIEPQMLCTFLTIDTAETDKNYNDATVFSFWGVYKLTNKFVKLDNEFGLHWLDCREIRVEPRDLEQQFWDFYAETMRHSVKPSIVIIEKKSTGVTLSSVLSQARGLRVLSVERTRASGNKITRYNEMQPTFAAKKVSLTKDAHHTEKCIKHMISLTRNGAHAHDDIADTAYDAWRATYKDKIVTSNFISSHVHDKIAEDIMSGYERQNASYQSMISSSSFIL